MLSVEHHKQGIFEWLKSRKGRSAIEHPILLHIRQTHWAGLPTFQAPGTFFQQRITKDVWELPHVVQNETKMMDPPTWHAKKPVGKVHHQHHPISLLPRIHH